MLATIAYFFRWLLRTIFGYLNALIYWVDAELYDLMMDIAGAKIFKQETILTVSGRIYQLLGLIMLFKLIFSFVTYIINPDDMTDKNKGYANLVKKIIISLCLIVITPWAFTQSRNLQIYIIEDKVIEYFVFGQTMPSNATAGNNFMNTVSTLVMQPYKCADKGCTAMHSQNLDERELCSSDWIRNLVNIDDAGKVNADETNIGKCGYGAGSDADYALALKKASTLSANGSYNFTARMTLGMYGKQTDGGWNSDFYVHDQLFFLGSSLIGIMIGYMLIVMCIDVALRSVKLAFYEIIAPIPIISYVGFKDGKDSMLNKWFGEVLKTYADLFTRIAGLQLSIFFINLIMDDGVVVNGEGVINTIFVNIFLIFGALTFAKQLPKILEGMGIKFSGGGFNLKKKVMEDAYGKQLISGGRRLAGGAAGLVAGGVVGAASNAAARWHQQRAEGKNGLISLGRAALSGLGGAATGTARGVVKGVSSKSMGKALHAAGQGGRYIQADSSFLGRTAAAIQKNAGWETRAQTMEKHMKTRDSIKGKMDAFETELDKEAKKNNFALGGMSIPNIGGGSLTLSSSDHYAQVLSTIEMAKARGVGSIRINGQAVGAHEYDAVIKGIQEQVYAQMTDGSGSLGGYKIKSGDTLDYMMQEIDRDIQHSGDKELIDKYRAEVKNGHQGHAAGKAAVKSGQAATAREKAASGAGSYQRAQANDKFAGKPDKK